MSALRASRGVRHAVIMVSGRQFELSFHCLSRYRERVCPGVSLREAKSRLRGLLPRAEITLALPDWSRGVLLPSQVPDEWLGLRDEGLLFPVVQGRILTCYARGRAGAQVRIVGGS